jgi:hypothetical protein
MFYIIAGIIVFSMIYEKTVRSEEVDVSKNFYLRRCTIG